MAKRLVSVDSSYLFPTPLEARLAAKMTASVTDDAVSAQINGAQTGPAIDHRIGIQVAPVVEQITADYIASDQSVIDAAAAAVDASPKILELENAIPAEGQRAELAAIAAATVGSDLGTLNLNDFKGTGPGYQSNNANATLARNYPVEGMGGTCYNFPLIPSIGRPTQLFILNHWVGSAMYVRSFNGTAWSPWATYMTQNSSDSRYYQKTVLDPILAAKANLSIVPADSTEHDYRLSALRARRGPVVVRSQAAVVLAFDHGLTKYKSIVHAMLTARGLPVTLAVNSQLMSDPTNSGATTTDLSSWAAGSLVEIANHGRTHTYPSDLKNEIRGGREELEAIIGQPIDTYVQAGITGDTWGGTYEDVAGTSRGRIAYEAHAILAGVMPSSDLLYPIDGEPNPGAKGTWIDNGGATIATAKAKISEAVAAGKMTIIRLHPEHIDGVGRITTTELTELLDWIVAERTAKRVSVLQLRDASIAKHAPLEATKSVRLENGAWVWDTTAGTHYLLPDHTGALVARATPWPIPDASTRTLNW